MSAEQDKKRGGARKGAGRKKALPPPAALDGRSAVAKNIAGRVLDQAKSEKLWLSLIRLECKRLGIGDNGELAKAEKGVVDSGEFQGNFSIIPLTNLLRYLEDRHYGRPVDTVNHLHDKPLEITGSIKISEIVREVRERKEKYERGKHS